MPISPFILNLRRLVGYELLHLIGVSAVVFDEGGRVLLVRTKETPLWMPIGGMIEVGEEPAAAAVREVREETGIDAAVQRLVGVFDGPPVTYRNGDRAHFVTVVFRLEATGGVARPDQDETTDVRFFDPSALPPLRDDHRRNVDLAAAEHGEAAFVRGEQ